MSLLYVTCFAKFIYGQKSVTYFCQKLITYVINIYQVKLYLWTKGIQEMNSN